MSDITITRLQLEAWATAVGIAIEAFDSLVRTPSVLAERLLEQALEDMRDELAEEADEEDDEPDLYDPDAPSDGWQAEDQLSELDDPDFRPTYL